MNLLSSDSVGGLSVSRETILTLQAFEAEVRRWSPVINLVSRGSLNHIWQRHIEDSAQLFQACPPDARTWVDLGSGGGFPGLVVAILARELRPDLRVLLVESDQRKATFLRQTAHKLGLQVDVQTARAESLPPQAADVLSARALASLSELLDLALLHLRPGGIALFPKGARHREEVEVTKKSWILDLDYAPSLSDPDAALLIIRKFHRAKPT
jgi:16S rRNA (guanine527-N7)-methyltransferase